MILEIGEEFGEALKIAKKKNNVVWLDLISGLLVLVSGLHSSMTYAI